MAAPMVTRKRNFVRKFHLPVSYPSETTFQNFSAYRSRSDNIGNCSNAHQSILSNSHGFSCSLPLPLMFDYGKQTKDEKKVTVNKQVSTYPNSCLAYIPRDEYTGCLMLPSGPEFKDYPNSCLAYIPRDEYSGCLMLPSGPEFKDYPNSCLAYIPRDEYSGCLMLPSGPDFKDVRICNIEHKQGHCMEVKNTTLMDVHSRVVGIHSQMVQSQGMMGRLEKVCEDKSDIQLGVISYWCNVHYGSHPRCLVYSDCSSVRVYDIRCPIVTPLKLFTKEDLHSDDRDQFRVCQNSSLSTFYHTLATDNNVYLLDERFPKMPLLKVLHMLQSPPAYMTEFCHNEDVHLYLGSLQKPDIHRVSWRSADDHTPHVIESPYRMPRKIDLLGCQDIHCKNTQLVTDKLSSPLLGLQTIAHDKGHTVLQLDRNGEVFYQVFQEKRQQPSPEAMEVDNSGQFPEPSNDITPSLDIAGGVKQIRDWKDKWDKGSIEKKDVNKTRDISTFFSVDNSEQFPESSNDIEPSIELVGGVKHVRDWMDKWDKGPIEKKDVNRTKDISTFFSGMVEGFPGFIACPLCMGTISEVVDVTQYSHVKCPACQNRVSDASAVKTGARKDGVVPTNNSKVPKRKRESAEDGKDWNKLSHALYDSWYGDPETSSPTDKLKEDDKG